jgi:hypothetical protein
MKTSESVDKISEALSLAQGEIGTVSFNKINPHFKSRYADLAGIREACKLPLSKHGLCILQSPGFAEGRVNLLTRIAHKSGQWIESELTLRPKDDTPQSIGSCITYARRYAIISMLAIVADEDDDGNGAQHDPKANQSSRYQGMANQNPQETARGPSLRPSDAPRKVSGISEAPQSSGSSLGFNPDDQHHVSILRTQLQTRNIPESFWAEIAFNMKGQSSDDLDNVLMAILDKKDVS